MKAEGFNAHSKYRIIKHALKEGNVSLPVSKKTYIISQKARGY